VDHTIVIGNPKPSRAARHPAHVAFRARPAPRADSLVNLDIAPVAKGSIA
jgi:hypothetical protein